MKLLEGWPLIEGELWNETNFDLIDLITKIRSYGFENRFLFNIRVAPDFRRNTKNIIYVNFDIDLLEYIEYLYYIEFTQQIGEPIFACLTNKELIDTNTPKIKYYLNFMVDVAVLLGADEGKAEQHLKDVILFESKIANVNYLKKTYHIK